LASGLTQFLILGEPTYIRELSLVDVTKLLEYNEIVRHRYFEKLSKLSWKELDKNREASFHSLKNIFVHTLSAIDYWIDFLKKESLRSRRRYDEYLTIKEVKHYMKHVEKRTHDYLSSLTTEGLNNKLTVTDENGKTFEVTAEDILIHVFEEEVHHRGELIALLWQMNVEPPPMGWKGL
jgi:uncharacterized damage-inducible protein DinB